MKIYKSKVDWWLGLVLVYPIFRSVASIIEGDWIGYIGIALCLLFIVFISKSTRYMISENHLIVKCMFIVNDKIETVFKYHWAKEIIISYHQNTILFQNI